MSWGWAVASSELEQMLSDAATEVLECMFFTSVIGDPEPGKYPPEQWILARLSFRGNPAGRFGAGTPLETGRKITAAFLGGEEDTLTERQIGEVICELANMLCGSVLSSLARETRFELSHPEIEPPGAVFPRDATACRTFRLEEGPLAVWLELERAV